MTTLSRRRFLQWTSASAGLALLTACQPLIVPPTAAQPAAAAPYADLPATLITELEKEAQATLEKYRVPGMAVGIVKDGQLIYSKGFGVADSKSGKPLTPQSVQSMASVSKAFTATAIMQLVEAGKLDVDQPLVEYVSGHPESRELTTKSSGKVGLVDRTILSNLPGRWLSSPSVPVEPMFPTFVWTTNATNKLPSAIY